jgi:membrane protease subunit (stomatin/prohibitin family)
MFPQLLFYLVARSIGALSPFGFFTSEFIEIIEWLQANEDDTICWKFPHRDNAIKNGAKLVVREGQRALFLTMGSLPAADLPPQLVSVETPHGDTRMFIGDSFGPGTYTLETRVLPILGKLQGWKHGFESPFKADVYFLSTRRFTNQKWGTQNPIMLRDAEFGPVRIRAFGTYAMQVADPVKFLRELVATDPSFQTYEIAQQLRSLVVSKFTQAVASSRIPVLDMATNLDEFGRLIREALAPEFDAMGLAVPLFLVENVSLPPELEQVLDKRASMGILGNLDQYTKLQAANALTAAAQNPSGGAGSAMGIGAGMALGAQMAAALQPQAAPAAPPAGGPPPVPSAAPLWFAAINGQQAGPYAESTLANMIASGQVTRQTLLWKQGLAAWSAAGQLPEFAQFFASVPPPLPPHM